jgi:hypothetical protein
MGGAGAGGADEDELPVDPSMPTPTLRLPQNGHATGSVWSEPSRHPRFAWDAQAGVTFELQVDDSCAVGALQDCEFPSPEWSRARLGSNEITLPRALAVREEAPVGTRYSWRVRSCTSEACSPWSHVRYLDVGRQGSDLDGDGFADVIVPDPFHHPRHGRVFVGLGPVPSNRPVLLEDDTPIETPNHFGQTAIAIGDMDADGFGDLLVTAAGDESLPQIAYVYFGGSSFTDPSSRARLPVEVPPGTRIAHVAAAGDVDADGLQDIVIDTSPSGPLLFRSKGRSVASVSVVVAQPGEWSQQTSAGDVTGDGYSDLLVSTLVRAPGFSARYDLLRGTAAGLAATETFVATANPYPWWVVTSDVNGDGFSDLGSVFDRSDAAPNRIHVSWGTQTPRFDQSAITWAGGVEGIVDMYPAIPAGDVNADGLEDSLAGFGWHNSKVAQANLYLGGQTSRTAPDAAYSFEISDLLFVSVGAPLAPGDVDGDGADDVVLLHEFGRTARVFFGGEALDTTPGDIIDLSSHP